MLEVFLSLVMGSGMAREAGSKDCPGDFMSSEGVPIRGLTAVKNLRW